MSKLESKWNVYRTRFLIRARQLNGRLVFTDALGREHRGQTGDYLVESSEGARRIVPREIFEDVYVAMGPADQVFGPGNVTSMPPLPKRRASVRLVPQA
ncbi:MAG: hypothetical protein JOY93_11955 [Acidobacteriales bacterium]|nr:hypothetical protein [Terriglobales bacterium]